MALTVSIPRVHQLKAQALDKLKAALAGVAAVGGEGAQAAAVQAVVGKIIFNYISF